MTAKRFHIRHPAQIWQWEQALKAGRLKPDKQRRTGHMPKQDNELLRIQVAYLKKLEALAQEKKKIQTKAKWS